MVRSQIGTSNFVSKRVDLSYDTSLNATLHKDVYS